MFVRCVRLLANQCLELAGRHVQGAMELRITWGAAVESFNSLLPAGRQQPECIR